MSASPNLGAEHSPEENPPLASNISPWNSSLSHGLPRGKNHNNMRQLTLLSSLLLLSPVWAATCYWPSGKVAGDNWLQCPGSKHCCAETEACLSNGLCVAGKYMTVYRGACTDDSWPISECPRVCYEGKPVWSLSFSISLLAISSFEYGD